MGGEGSMASNPGSRDTRKPDDFRGNINPENWNNLPGFSLFNLNFWKYNFLLWLWICVAANTVFITLKAFRKCYLCLLPPQIQIKCFSDSLIQFSHQTQAPVYFIFLKESYFKRSFKTMWTNVTRLKSSAMLNRTNVLE